MEAFNKFWAKLRNAWKSGTMYLAAVVATFGGGLLFCQYIQTEWLPLLQPFLSTEVFGYVSLAISIAIGYFRFKTVTSLANK
jgi:hypothetical protein